MDMRAHAVQPESGWPRGSQLSPWVIAAAIWAGIACGVWWFQFWSGSSSTDPIQRAGRLLLLLLVLGVSLLFRAPLIGLGNHPGQSMRDRLRRRLLGSADVCRRAELRRAKLRDALQTSQPSERLRFVARLTESCLRTCSRLSDWFLRRVRRVLLQLSQRVGNRRDISEPQLLGLDLLMVTANVHFLGCFICNSAETYEVGLLLLITASVEVLLHKELHRKGHLQVLLGGQPNLQAIEDEDADEVSFDELPAGSSESMVKVDNSHSTSNELVGSKAPSATVDSEHSTSGAAREEWIGRSAELDSHSSDGDTSDGGMSTVARASAVLDDSDASLPIRETSESLDEHGQRVMSGSIECKWQPEQRHETISIGFCPPFDSTPAVEIETDWEQVTAQLLVATPAGARIELRGGRSLPAHSFRIEWYAYPSAAGLPQATLPLP